MRLNRGAALLSLVGVLGATAVRGQEPVLEAIPNWPAPATWSPLGVSRGLSTMAAITSPLPFIGLAPCRIADTRNAPGPYGAPALSAGAPRNFTLTGQCGIPAGAAAASLNVTVTNTQGPGFILIYPQGGSQPTVSTLNYVGNQTIANAAVVPLGSGGGVTVIAGVSGTDLIIDTNGYYGPGVGADNTFLGVNAGNFTMTGLGNTGIGNSALLNNGSGSDNTAIGWDALVSNSTGNSNTATGTGALINNTGGSSNTATGFNAMSGNLAGGQNTAIGDRALSSNTAGSSNVAVGFEALQLTNGTNNVAVGAQALQNNTGGSNIALGTGAGINLTSGGFNMYLGNEGVASESTTIRIGSGLLHTRLFVAGVLSSAVTGTQVLISGTGQLGVASSSIRYKEEIHDMGDASDRLAKLRPVTFRYKGHPDEPMQFGLIAEEVEQVFPELVFHSAAGQPETVLYHEMPAMLLNELQKQQKRIDSQAQEIARLLERVQTLEGRLSEVSAK